MSIKISSIFKKYHFNIGKVRPFYLFCFFLILIILYGSIYSFSAAIGSPGSNSPDKNWLDGIYFSTVTITTLGYGDLVPNSILGRLFVVTEVLIGVMVLGVFLNSLWQSHVDAINKANIIANDIALRAESARRLKIYLGYFKNVFSRYASAQMSVTTNPSNRLNQDLQASFSFNDLQWMYLPPLNVANNMSSTAIEVYYDRLEAVCVEIKYILSNFDIYHMEQLHEDFVNFLILTEGMDCKGALIGNQKLGIGAGSVVNMVVNQIKTLPPNPIPAQYPSNMILPYIIFYYFLLGVSDISMRISKFIDDLLIEDK